MAIDQGGVETSRPTSLADPPFGKNLRERVEALVGIADPRFRDDLERAARDRRLLV